MTRTDNDTWDLASSVGATATMVAAARAVATSADRPADRRSRSPSRWCAPSASTSSPGWPPATIPADLDDEISGRHEPDDRQHGGADQVLRRLLPRRRRRAGIRQAVILASGLDSRAYRLPWPAGTVVYEIDQPEVIAFKTETLAELGAEPDTRPAHRRDRPARRLARRAAARPASTRTPPDGVERRGPARLPAARRAGPAARHHHRAVARRAAGWRPRARRPSDPDAGGAVAGADAGLRRPLARPRLRPRLRRAGLPRRAQRGRPPTCSGHGWQVAGTPINDLLTAYGLRSVRRRRRADSADAQSTSPPS